MPALIAVAMITLWAAYQAAEAIAVWTYVVALETPSRTVLIVILACYGAGYGVLLLMTIWIMIRAPYAKPHLDGGQRRPVGNGVVAGAGALVLATIAPVLIVLIASHTGSSGTTAAPALEIESHPAPGQSVIEGPSPAPVPRDLAQSLPTPPPEPGPAPSPDTTVGIPPSVVTTPPPTPTTAAPTTTMPATTTTTLPLPVAEISTTTTTQHQVPGPTTTVVAIQKLSPDSRLGTSLPWVLNDGTVYAVVAPADAGAGHHQLVIHAVARRPGDCVSGVRVQFGDGADLHISRSTGEPLSQTLDTTMGHTYPSAGSFPVVVTVQLKPCDGGPLEERPLKGTVQASGA